MSAALVRSNSGGSVPGAGSPKGAAGAAAGKVKKEEVTLATVWTGTKMQFLAYGNTVAYYAPLPIILYLGLRVSGASVGDFFRSATRLPLSG